MENFLASCDAQPNATRAMCECSAERVQESFTYEEFRREDRAIAEGRPASGRLLEVFARCRGRTERYPYPPQVLGNFVTSCEAKGGTRSECGCAADELQNKLPFEEFVREEEAIAKGRPLSERLTDVVKGCRGK